MKKIFSEKTKIYLIYTILFIITASIVFFIFVYHKNSFIWQSDGIKQHYIILKDFNEKVRNFFNNTENGMTLFSWNMGLGLDVIGQYSYYILGDPFAYISLLFPMQYLEYAYNILILIRLYCVGLAFIFYAKYHYKRKINLYKEQNDRKFYNNKILVGAIIYTFSSYTLFAGVRHPYFLNAMILFPLLLWGIDKLLDENKKVPFTALIAISAISNYYFFYMITIMTVIYAIIRYVCEYRKEGIKHFLKKLGSAILCFIIGVLIASIILLPTIYAFLNSARSGEEVVYQYSSEYYKKLFTINLLSVYGENWSYIGVSSIILIMLPILLKRRKENSTYLIYLIIATIILLVPFLVSIMNGFSFPNNRWSFIYTFILSYIITLCFDNKYTKKEIKYMIIFLIGYSLIAVLAIFYLKSKPCFKIFLAQIVIAFLIMAVIWYQNTTNHKKLKSISIVAVYALIIINIFIMSYGLYSHYDKNYANEFIELEKCEENLSTQLGNNKSYEKNIKNIIEQDKSFYRIAKVPHQIQNLSIYYGYNSAECFLSIGNKYVYDLSKELVDNNYSTTNNIRGMGDRTKITTLLGTKYYVVDDKYKNCIPYAYYLKEKNNGVYTYENKFPLSLGVCYSDYMLREDYEKLNPFEKEDALLKTAVVDNLEDLNGLEINQKDNIDDIRSSYVKVPYKIIDKNNVLNSNDNVKEINIVEKNQGLSIEIPTINNSEIYVFISGFEFKGTSKHIITASYNNKSISKTIDDKITSAYYQKSPQILLNLGYYDKAEGEIQLKFSAKGKYQFKELQVIAVPMNTYEQTIKKLQEDELKEITYSNKEIKGKIDIEQDSILQISTSYTSGWKAYIDGNKVNTIKTNTAFIGIPVKKGEHEIRLIYETPYLKQGIILSVVGVTLLVILIIVEKKQIY